MSTSVPSAAARAVRSAAIRRAAGWLLVQLVSIFLGVSAAFYAENTRQARAEAARARQFYRAVDVELGVFIGPAAELADTMSARIAVFDSARAHGAAPALPGYRELRAERPPSAVWDAALASGAVNAVEPTVFYDLARFYNRVRSLGDRYLRYTSLSEQRQLPQAGDDPRMFYTPGPDGRPALRGEYRTQLQMLGEIRDELRRLGVEAHDLQRRVRVLAAAQ